MGSKMFDKRLARLMPNERAMFLAYDQGMEHGPRDFSPGLSNENPSTILFIAKHGGFTGVVLLPGDAEKYYDKSVKTPLILKVNSKSELWSRNDPYSPLLFERAADAVGAACNLGAAALGYTIYLGSRFEHLMIKEFTGLARVAHSNGFPVIAWVYPRSNEWTWFKARVKEVIKFKETSLNDEEVKKVAKPVLKDQSSALIQAVSEAVVRDCGVDETPTIVAYAASAGARLGADIVKIKYSGDVKSFRWAVRCAGKTRVVMSGGPKRGDFLKQVKEVIEAGGIGVAVGRNIWQDEFPLVRAKELREVIFKEVDAK